MSPLHDCRLRLQLRGAGIGSESINESTCNWPAWWKLHPTARRNTNGLISRKRTCKPRRNRGWQFSSAALTVRNRSGIDCESPAGQQKCRGELERIALRFCDVVGDGGSAGHCAALFVGDEAPAGPGSSARV